MSGGPRDIGSLSPEQRAELERRLLRNRKRGARSASIPVRPAGSEVPLSQAQQRLWFLEQLQPGSAGYNINGAARLAGRLDEPALRAALAAVVVRHESLRTTFAIDDGEPVQRVGAPGEFEMGLVDLTGLAVAAREAEAIRLVTDEAERPFDLARGPLFRATLVRLDAAEHMLAITMHHIVSDGWSLGVFVRELGALYAAQLDRRPSPLAPMPIQYGDYAAWQRRTDDRAAAESHVAFWTGRLASPLPVLDLPVDRRRPAVLTHRGATLLLEWPAPLLDRLKALSVDTDGTLFTTLMAGYAALLARYARQDDVVVGFPVAGRGRAELEPLIGFFVNTLVLRTDLSGDPTFRQLLRRVREASIDAFAHQDMAFDRLVEVLQPSREMGRHPLFQVGFALQNAPMPSLELPGVVVTGVVVPRTRARFDLHVAMWEDRGRLAGSIEYSTDLFDAATVRRFGEHFRRLLEAAIARPDTRVSSLAITSPEDVRLLSDWNATRRDDADGRTIHAEFEARAAETPEAVAVTCGAERLTYRELNARANRLAHYLQGAGVGPDVLVGVCLDRSSALVVAVLGILKAGGAYVPLDASYPRERLAFMIDDTAVRFVVSSRQLASNLPTGETRRLILVDGDASAIAAAPATNPASGAGTDHLAYVIYTSGSTGRPKGVEVPHRGVLRLVRGASYVRLDRRATFLVLAPISFDASTFEIWGALLNGARCAIFAEPLPTTESLRHAIAAERVTTLWLTASLFNALVDDDPGALAPIEQLLIGGEALSAPHVRRAYAKLPGVTIINGYGPTESTTFTCCHTIARELPEAITSIPIGRPISNTRVYVLDSHLQLQPPGVPGELYIGGDGLARGYLRRAELTAERFVPNPFGDPGSRLYRTGDLVRHLDDGRIEFLGRFDDQVKIRGFRIEPGEIESVLHEHGTVREVVVVARASESLGTTLVAYVVPSSAGSADVPGPIADGLREFARSRLPEYMIPAFVLLDALPLTRNGKVDRDRLPAPVLDRAAAGAYVAPRNDIETSIAAVWSAALNVERVGANDNFFDLGGHSLLLVKVHRLLRDVLPREISVVDLFQYPTVTALALHVAGGPQVSAAPGRRQARRARAAD
ncbi:MAG: amino acid adenylation domain-containing protein, partial [Acidobacteriota bacterium]